jgi:hypothetical protein
MDITDRSGSQMVYLLAQGLGTTARSIFTDTSITIMITARVIGDRFQLGASTQPTTGETFTAKQCTTLKGMKRLEDGGNTGAA